MTPEEKQMLKELYDWMQERKRQVIPYPIDDASLNAVSERLSSVVFDSTSSASLTQVYTDSAGHTHTGPKAYSGRLIVVANGTTYHIPTLTVV